MVTIIEQTWWHIEEIYHPSPARKIRQVMDIFTNETEFPIEIDNHFVGLRVIARNLGNREIPFIEAEGENTIILNLNLLDSLPLAPVKDSYLFSWNEIPGNDNLVLIEFLTQKFGIDWLKTAKIEKIESGRTIRITAGKKFLSLILNNEKIKVNTEIGDLRTDEFIVKTEGGKINIYQKNNLRHIKIEFEYIYTKPRIIKVPYHPFKRESHADINGQIQPEVYITLPLGWRMDGNSFKKLGFGKNKEGYHVGMTCKVKNDLKHNNGIKLIPSNQSDSIEKELIFTPPFINLVHGKRKYSYTLKEECYKELNQILKDKKNEDISYSLFFTSQIDLKIFCISIFPFFFLFTSAALIAVKFSMISSIVNGSSLAASYSMPFIIVLMSFSFFYYSLIKDGYSIPFKRYYILIFSMSIITFLICAFYSSNSPELTNCLNNTLNNTTP